MSTKSYNPKEIEPKWQKIWAEQKLFEADDSSKKKTKYVLDMFPYPSGDGLHVGHVKIYTGSDVAARYWRMKGFEVLHPMGWDAFGLPTENAAIKYGLHPRQQTDKNIKRFREQMQMVGLSYDWSREFDTTDPNYYKWTQWIFLKLFKRNLAYEDNVPINWCPSCKTGLANEEVTDGKCEICGSEVEKRPMRQWMLKITDYAERLLSGLAILDWPKFILEMQRNWIGQSHGAEINFSVEDSNESIAVFTTRPDTIFGATYLILAPEHQLVRQLVTDEQKKAVEEYLDQASNKSDLERTDLAKKKTGIFTGRYAVNPSNNEKIPIWIADYVLTSYGTGAIMAVPAHDQRDYDFAKQFDLPIKMVICPHYPAKTCPVLDQAYVGEGHLVESGEFNGMPSQQAGSEIIDYLEQRGMGKSAVNYKLRDWVFSRQRYWGEPIPLIHCDKCGIVPVPEEDLPVELPQIENFKPSNTGEPPLAAITEWVNVKCPKCKGKAKRETNTMPQWAGSSWYFLRFTDPHNNNMLADQKKLSAWMPVDIYVGGAEHAVLHLLYARFWHMVLSDEGIVNDPEPFINLRNVGLLMGPDGQKMSKSRGNVITPDEMVVKFGADSLRTYEMFMGPFNQSEAWSEEGITGSNRFIQRVWKVIIDHLEKTKESENDAVAIKLHQSIKGISQSIENFRFNTGVSALMELLNTIAKEKNVTKLTLENFVILLSPYAPHISEELWNRLGHDESIINSLWPTANEKILSKAEITIPIQVNGKVRGSISVVNGINQADIEAAAFEVPNVKKHIAGKKPQRIVYVPNKLINFVIK